MPKVCQPPDTTTIVSNARRHLGHVNFRAYLFIEPLDPAIQILKLLRRQVIARVQWSIQVFRQHLLVKALAGQASRSISTGKVFIRPAWTVEISSAAHVVDLAPDGQIYGSIVFAIVFE